MGKAIRDVYGESLAKYGQQNTDVVVFDADVSGSTKSATFAKVCPDRFFNMGIAEAGMTAAAAGMATVGKIPFVNTFAVFITSLGLLPSLAFGSYSKIPIKLCGAYGGMSDAYDGPSHHSLEDIAIMRSLPNFKVFVPCDAVQTDWVVKNAIEDPSPMYLRFSRDAFPDVYAPGETFESGKGREVREGLAALGVNVEHVIAAPKGMGMWLAILDESGNLAGSISRQPDFSTLEAYLQENGDAIMATADGVALEFDMNAEISRLVMALAKKHNKPVYSIVGNMGVILRHPEFLHDVACFICNEMEAGRLFREDLTQLAPEAMLEALKRGSAVAGIPAMVITMGPHGAVYVDNTTGEFGYCPPMDVPVVDTTGAGDAFFSAAVAALMSGAPLSQAVQEGTHLAAQTLQVEGSCAR